MTRKTEKTCQPERAGLFGVTDEARPTTTGITILA